MDTSFLSELLTTIAERGRAVLNRPSSREEKGPAPDLAQLCRALVSRRGEASGVALATEIFARWDKAGPAERRWLLIDLVEQFGPDRARLERAIAAWQENPTPSTLLELHAAAEPKRQEVVRRLNLAPGGTRKLVHMREELFRHQAECPVLDALDADFAHLFSSWFNRGFLVLRRIDWSTPANILEKIIRYEAVHAIRDWNDLRRRIEPEDRRLFAFFHPQLVDDPLIFVEVALTSSIPDAIAPLLAEDRSQMRAADATTAVFYSISNCHEGLRGVSFGNFLIKQVVEDLKRELPGLTTFVTLSPVPGFAPWLARERVAAPDSLASPDREALAALEIPRWHEDPTALARVREPLLNAAAFYLLEAKTARGRPLDPVARFHLGNGARLERLNFLGDRSARGLERAHGLMVNYLYDLDNIEKNHEAFAEKGEVAAAPAIRKRLRSHAPARVPAPTTGASKP
jgi:malonyl-CoA decarboxylase